MTTIPLHIVNTREAVFNLTLPALGDRYRVETETCEACEVLRARDGVLVVDETGDVHGPFAPVSRHQEWQRCVADVLYLDR